MLSGSSWLFSLYFLFISVATSAMGLDESIQRRLRDSPFIAAQRKQADLTAGDRWRRFLVHEPQFIYNNVDSSNQESWGLGLVTPFPGKSFAYTEFDRVRAATEKAEIGAKKQDLAKQVSDAYLDCAGSRALLEIQQLAIHDLETLWHSLSAMYESGHASQAERIGAELQLRQTQADLATSTDKAETTCRKWRKLMAHEGSELMPDGVPEDLTPTTMAELGSRSADETRGEAAFALAEANDHLRWWAQAPDLNWSYARNHYLNLPTSQTGAEWTTTVGVTVTIPIFFFAAESIEAQRTRAQANIDRHAAEVQTLNARADREDAGKEFRRDKDRLKQLREKDIALAEALVQSTLSAYKIGKLGFAELMMSRKTLSDLRTQMVQLKVATVQARLRCLDQCESASPEPRKL